MDDIMFSYHGVNGPESSTALCLEDFCQVAVALDEWTSDNNTG